jgi:hypothetical protein
MSPFTNDVLYYFPRHRVISPNLFIRTSNDLKSSRKARFHFRPVPDPSHIHSHIPGLLTIDISLIRC